MWWRELQAQKDLWPPLPGPDESLIVDPAAIICRWGCAGCSAAARSSSAHARRFVTALTSRARSRSAATA